jgi:hypothetical protein
MIMTSVEAGSPWATAFMQIHREIERLNNAGAHEDVRYSRACMAEEGAERRLLKVVPSCETDLAIAALVGFRRLDAALADHGVHHHYVEDVKLVCHALANVWRFAVDRSALDTAQYANAVGIPWQFGDDRRGYSRPENLKDF